MYSYHFFMLFLMDNGILPPSLMEGEGILGRETGN
jgi:hypothetical protein